MYTKNDLSRYYAILEINEQATSKEIRKAYYKKALELHPDKNLYTDTNDAMKELNQAYEILSSIAFYKTNGDDFQFFPSKTKAKQYKSHIPSSTFQFECGWFIKIFDDDVIYISHPTFRGCKYEIAISQYEKKPYIGLPLNFNETRRNRLWRQLMSICRDYGHWHMDSVELCFGLPENRSLWPDIMDCIFRTYKTPLPLNQFLAKRLDLPVSDKKNSIPDFYSYPGMHLHDIWETHLTSKHLFIKHPKITKTAPLTFFNFFEPQFCITLPVDTNQKLFKFLNEKLLPMIPEKPVMNNLYELVINIDKSEHLDDILQCIFDLYEIPERIAKPIRQECISPGAGPNYTKTS